MKCLKCKQDKANINEATGICLDCVTPLRETHVEKRLVGKRGFFEGKTITLSLSTGQYGGCISAHMKSDGPVRQYGMRTSRSSITVMIHEEDVTSVVAGEIRLMALVHELETQGWEVQKDG